MDPAFTSSKEYSDLLYGYLMSKADENNRVIKRNYSFTTLEHELAGSMNRKTVAKYVNGLLELGLLREEDGYYVFTALTHGDGYMMGEEVLRRLVAYKMKYLISGYVYLCRGWAINNNAPYVITMKNMKRYLGIATSTTSNNDVINNILTVLQEEGLVECKLVYDPAQQHSYYKIMKVQQ